MKTLHIYLNFDGNCKEAFSHYAAVLNTKVTDIHTYADVPPNSGMADVGDAHRNRIMHCSISINDNITIMGSDVAGEYCQQFKPGNNYSISLHVEDRKEADRVFAGLSEGGNAVMPLAETFWEAYWGMCVDKFGVQWMVSAAV